MHRALGGSCTTEMYTWDLCNPMSQCHPSTFNENLKKKKTQHDATCKSLKAEGYSNKCFCDYLEKHVSPPKEEEYMEVGCFLVKHIAWKQIQLETEFYNIALDYCILVVYPKYFILFYFLMFYLFIFREGGREGEREGEKHQCVVCLLHTPYWGPGLQPRHVPWLGIEPATLWFGRPTLHPLSYTSQVS